MYTQPYVYMFIEKKKNKVSVINIQKKKRVLF